MQGNADDDQVGSERDQHPPADEAAGAGLPFRCPQRYRESRYAGENVVQ